MTKHAPTLTSILDNVALNKAQIQTQIIASTKALGEATPEVLAALDLLVEFYGPNVQVIGQTIGAKLQIEQLKKTAVEVDTLIATLQVALDDEDLDSKLTQRQSANVIREAAAANE